MQAKQIAVCRLHQLGEPRLELGVVMLVEDADGFWVLLAFRVEYADESENIENVCFVVRSDAKLLKRLGAYLGREGTSQVRDRLNQASRS